MINQLLIEEVFGQPLCIDSNYAQSMAVLAYTAFSSNKPLSGIRYEAAYAVIPQSGAKQTSGTYAKGSVGVVVMDNPIVQNSDPWYGIKGTIEAAQELQALDADPNIIGTVLCMNSGGGAVYAIKPITDVLSGLEKPVVTFSKLLIASAAYRIGANTNHIMMYHPQGIAGSLGTMMSMSDMQPMLEKWGMTFHDHYATASVLKNKTFTDAQKGDAKALRANMLDPMNDLFIADIKRLRGDKISADEKSIYQGETFLADPQGLSLGLIDSLGNFDAAVQKVVELSGSASSTKSSNTSQNNLTEMKTEAIAALAGKTDPSQEELDLANANLTEAGITGVSLMPDSVIDAAAQVTKDKEALETANATLKTELATAEGKVTSLTSENTVLKAKVDKMPSVVGSVTSEADKNTTPTQEEEDAEEMAGYAHNQYLKNL